MIIWETSEETCTQEIELKPFQTSAKILGGLQQEDERGKEKKSLLEIRTIKGNLTVIDLCMG